MALKRTAKACGPDTPALVSSWRKAMSALSGATRRYRWRRWQTSRSPGRARGSLLKPLRGECRVFLGCFRGDDTRMLFSFACEAAGAVSARLPRALWLEGKEFPASLGHIVSRECEPVSTSLRGA